jgi:hypothetical protein
MWVATQSSSPLESGPGASSAYNLSFILDSKEVADLIEETHELLRVLICVGVVDSSSSSQAGYYT